MWLLTFVASLLAASPNTLNENGNGSAVANQSQPQQQQQQSSPDRTFWDLDSFQADEREKLLRKALDITELEGYIDWDLLHDNYVKAVLLDSASTEPKHETTTPTRTLTLNSAVSVEEDAGSRRRLDDKDNMEEDDVEEKEEEEEEDFEEEEEEEEEDRKLSRQRVRRRRPSNKRKKRKKMRVNMKRKRASEQNKALTAKATAPGVSTTTSTGTNFGSGGSILIPVYNYSLGNCPGEGNSPLAIPCAPPNLKEICDKYSSQGSFRTCLTTCEPSFCCIHNAPVATNTYAPNCNKDINCAQWAHCYIAWWKLADHIGPATRLRVEQYDPFYDVPAEDITALLQSNFEFYKQFLFHFFKDSARIIQLGTVQVNATLSNFDIDRIILNSTYWLTTL